MILLYIVFVRYSFLFFYFISMKYKKCLLSLDLRHLRGMNIMEEIKLNKSLIFQEFQYFTRSYYYVPYFKRIYIPNVCMYEMYVCIINKYSINIYTYIFVFLDIYIFCMYVCISRLSVTWIARSVDACIPPRSQIKNDGKICVQLIVFRRKIQSATRNTCIWIQTSLKK